jgi:hypothetical protein
VRHTPKPTNISRFRQIEKTCQGMGSAVKSPYLPEKSTICRELARAAANWQVVADLNRPTYVVAD